MSLLIALALVASPASAQDDAWEEPSEESSEDEGEAAPEEQTWSDAWEDPAPPVKAKPSDAWEDAGDAPAPAVKSAPADGWEEPTKSPDPPEFSDAWEDPTPVKRAPSAWDARAAEPVPEVVVALPKPDRSLVGRSATERVFAEPSPVVEAPSIPAFARIQRPEAQAESSDVLWSEYAAGADVVQAYRVRRLMIIDRQGGWEIVDGNGTRLDAFQFADLIEDERTQEQLDAELKVARRRGWIIAGTGAAMLATAAIPVVRLRPEGDAPVEEEFTERVRRDDFDSEDEYLSELDAQLAQYELAQAAFYNDQGKNADRRWLALALASGGTMALAVAPWTVHGAVQEKSVVTESFSRRQAQELVDEYNRQLRAELGLSNDQRDFYAAIDDELSLPPADTRSWTARPQVGVGYVGLQVRW